MSLLTQAYLLDTFGPRLTVEQMAQVLGLKPGTVYNQISALPRINSVSIGKYLCPACCIRSRLRLRYTHGRGAQGDR